MIGRFWWSQQDKINKIHWIGWRTLTKPKSMAGLGSEIYITSILQCYLDMRGDYCSIPTACMLKSHGLNIIQMAISSMLLRLMACLMHGEILEDR